MCIVLTKCVFVSVRLSSKFPSQKCAQCLSRHFHVHGTEFFFEADTLLEATLHMHRFVVFFCASFGSLARYNLNSMGKALLLLVVVDDDDDDDADDDA